ncbi:hypothetical protein Tco_1215039 [Tanacetum coccineum]
MAERRGPKSKITSQEKKQKAKLGRGEWSDSVDLWSGEPEKEPKGPDELSRKQMMSADCRNGVTAVTSGGKGTRKPNLGGRRAGRPHTRQETRNLGLKAITDKSGPVPIRFEGVALALPSWRNVPDAEGVEVVWKDWDGNYDLERLSADVPRQISEDVTGPIHAQLAFWNDPKNLARAAQNKQNRAKSKVMERPQLLDEYPVADPHLLLTNTVGGVFLNKRTSSLWMRMLRLKGTRLQHPQGCAYTEDEIMALCSRGQQRGATFPVLTGLLRTGLRSFSPSQRRAHTTSARPQKDGRSSITNIE